MKIKTKKISCENLLAFHLCGFELLKPLTSNFSKFSTIILFGYVLIIICLASCSLLRDKNGRRLSYYIVFLCCSFLLYILELLFRGNELLNEYMYNYIIYALIPLYLFIGVENFTTFLKIFCRVACFTGILYLPDPVLGFRWSVNYMVFGFNIMLPAVLCATIYWLYYKKKFFVLLVGIFSCELIICGNKGAIITACVFVVCMFCWLKKTRVRQYVSVILVMVGVALTGFFRIQIIDMLIKLSKMFFPRSGYSLITLRAMLAGQGEHIYNIRINIWKTAWDYFLEHPFLGCGIGWYQNETGNYPHNLFFDILVTFGLIGILVFLIMFALSIIKLSSIKDLDLKIIIFVFFIGWSIPLMFSLTFFEVTSFWLYFACLFSMSDSHSLKQKHIQRKNTIFFQNILLKKLKFKF